MNIGDFLKMKTEKRKITMVTCYDHAMARLLDSSDVDCLLVGDSVSMVIHGHDTTLAATNKMMALHVGAVARGAKNKFIVGDMPFLSFRKGIPAAMESVEMIMRAGAHAVKLEGFQGHEDVVRHIVLSGVPVMGHLGLTPQSIHQFGGFKVQGRDAATADWIMGQARGLEASGCFAIVLECVPSALAARITEALHIPTIGIGAGASVDGQVLVLQDMLGFNQDFRPKFLKRYLQGGELVQSAVNSYVSEVKNGVFPSEQEAYQ